MILEIRLSRLLIVRSGSGVCLQADAVMNRVVAYSMSVVVW